MRARRIVRAYIGLGSNVGDPARTLASAVEAIADLPGLWVAGVSRLYATAPWGVTDQPEFRNAAVAVDIRYDDRDPADAALGILGRLKTIERAAGRRRRRRWGPRELDLDLLVFGRHRIDVERSREARSVDAEADPAKAAKRLEVPHRYLGERLFVLAPLADLAPAPRAAGLDGDRGDRAPASGRAGAARQRPRRRGMGPSPADLAARDRAKRVSPA